MSNPIRIAQILGKMDSGGIESVVLKYYENIDRSKVQFDFFFHENSNFLKIQEIRALGAGIYQIPSYSKFIKYQIVLQRLLKANKYNVAHVHLNTMSVFPLFAAWCAKIPVRICHNHSTSHIKEGAKSILKYILRPLCPIFATEFYACGEAAAAWMYGKRAFKQNKVHIMPNAIDIESFRYNQAARTAARKNFKIGDNSLVIGNVGRFTFAKNHELLIDIFFNIYKKHPDSVLFLIGEGELLGNIKQKVNKLNIADNVIFAGVYTDISPFYSLFDVFCLPSRYEGFPVVAVEAQASGAQVIASSNITKEIILTDNIKLLDISLGSEHWADVILSSVNNKDRQVDILPALDIKTQAKIQGDIYLSLDNMA